MSKLNEKEILRRLKLLSQIEPTSEAADRAVERVRHSLINKGKGQKSSNAKIWRMIIKSKITKLAAAAALLIVVGYATGRLSAPRPPDLRTRDGWD